MEAITIKEGESNPKGEFIMRTQLTVRGRALWGLLLAMVVALSATMPGAAVQAAAVAIVNANQWKDMSGNVIQAHAGGAIKVGSVYYWYGVERNEDAGWTFKQINLYSSTDLKSWTFVHAVLTQGSHPELNWSKVERPKIVYNAATGKFVMWMHYENGANYSLAHAAVAISDTVDGDYEFLGHFRPEAGGVEHQSRDATLFVDDDGTAYFISSARGNADLNVYRLNADYTQIDALTATLFPGNYREAPAMVKRNGYYYLLTSGATGWSYNQAKYAYSTNIASGWSSLYDIGSPSTFEGQGNFILPVSGTEGTDYIYMTDRHAGAFGEHFNYGKYVWHKLNFVSDTNLKLDWFPKLSIDTAAGKVEKAAQNNGTGLGLKKDFAPIDTFLSVGYEDEYFYMSDKLSAESAWEKIDVDGVYFILKHKRTGKYLHNDPALGNKLNLVDPVWTGHNVQWSQTDAGGGYVRLIHRSSGKVLTSYPYGANLSLQPTTNTSNQTKWRLVE